jgi:hypothetical protein
MSRTPDERFGRLNNPLDVMSMPVAFFGALQTGF